MTDRRSASGGPYLIVVASMISLSASILLTPLLARALGPDGRGEVAAAVAALNILPIVIGLGLPLVVRRLSAVGDGDAAIRAARLAILVLFIPSVALGWVLSWTVFGSMEDVEQLVTWAGLALAPVTVMWMVDASALVGTERYWAVLSVRLAQPLTFAVLILAAALSGGLSVAFAILAQSLANLVALVVAYICNRVSLFGRCYPLSSMVREGVTLTGGAIAEAISYRLDQILILPIAGAAQAGYYSIAVTLGSIPPAISQAVSAPNYREVVSAPAEARPEIILRGAREVVSISAVCVCAIGLLSYPVVPVLFGNEFRDARPVALIYLLGSLLICASSYASICLAALRRGAAMTLGQIGAAVVGVVLLFVLAPTAGAIGAAIATVATYGALSLYLNRCLRLGFLAFLPSVSSFRTALSRIFN